MTEKYERFVDNLRKLDDGDRARLKRNAGNTLSESRDVLGLFYRHLLYNIFVREDEEEVYFWVATLYPFEKQDRQRKMEGHDGTETAESPTRSRPANFGHSLHLVRSQENSEGLDRRVERLLDADRQQLPFYLRREVQFVNNESRRFDCIDWPQLLKDLLAWEYPDRYVQRRWARDYFRTQLEDKA